MTLKNNKKMVKKTKSTALKKRKFPVPDTPKLPSNHKKVAFKARLGEVDLTFDQPEGQEPPQAAMDKARRRLAGVSSAFDTLKVAHDRLVTANAKLISDNKALKKERQELRAKAGESDELREKLKDQHDKNNRLHGTLYTERKTTATLQSKLGKKDKGKIRERSAL